MANDEKSEGRIHRLVSKFGKVAAAAAALLAESPSDARENDPLSSILDRTHSAAVSPKGDEPDRLSSPPPLVLRPSFAGTKWMLAGHRSHSSHSSHGSHSSHVSGAMHTSHSSHYSSSTRFGSGSRSITTPAPAAPTQTFESSEVPSDSSSSPQYLNRYAPSRRTAPAPDPIPAEEPATPADFTDPAQRFRLITISNYGGIQKAFIKDQMFGEMKLFKVGETVGNCRLIAVSFAEMWARIKTPQGQEITIRRNRTGAR